MNPKTSKVAVMCVKIALSDQPWKDLGFRKRPKYGASFQRFRAQWKVRLENMLLREMIILFTVTYLSSGVVGLEQIDDLVQFYSSGPDGKQPLWKCYGYQSSAEAIEYFRESILAYMSTPQGKWSERLCSRCGFLNIPNKKFGATLLVRGIKFIETVREMIARPENLNVS
jgi:hypothetical protein